MNISQNGIDLIKSFEGLRLKAYKCVPTEKYYTIGYGHYGADVKADETITKEEAETILKKDLEKFVKNVDGYTHKYNFNQNQFDALCSFAFNLGSINQLTKNGTRTIEQIKEAIPKYVTSGGKTLNGLIKRRNKELELFNTPVSTCNESEVFVCPYLTKKNLCPLFKQE